MTSYIRHKCRKYLGIILKWLSKCKYKVSSSSEVFSTFRRQYVWKYTSGLMGVYNPPPPLGCHGNHLPPIWKRKFESKTLYLIWITLAKTFFVSWRTKSEIKKVRMQCLWSKEMINSEFRLTVLLENRKCIVIFWNRF